MSNSEEETPIYLEEEIDGMPKEENEDWTEEDEDWDEEDWQEDDQTTN